MADRVTRYASPIRPGLYPLSTATFDGKRRRTMPGGAPFRFCLPSRRLTGRRLASHRRRVPPRPRLDPAPAFAVSPSAPLPVRLLRQNSPSTTAPTRANAAHMATRFSLWAMTMRSSFRHLHAFLTLAWRLGSASSFVCCAAQWLNIKQLKSDLKKTPSCVSRARRRSTVRHYMKFSSIPRRNKSFFAVKGSYVSEIINADRGEAPDRARSLQEGRQP